MSKDKYIILRDREVMLTPVIWNAEAQTSPKLKRNYGRYLKNTWIFFENGRHRSSYLAKEWESVGKYIANRMIKDKSYFKNLESQVAAERKKMDNLKNELKTVDFSKLNFGQLFKMALKIKDLWVRFELANVSAWFIAGDFYLDLLENRLKVNREDLAVLATPREKTYVSKFEEDYLRNLLALRRRKTRPETAAEKLSDDYGWIPYNYDGPTYWDKKYFLKKLLKDKKSLIKIENELKLVRKKGSAENDRSKALLKKYSLTSDELRLIDVARVFGYWTDERKKHEYKLNYYYGQILLELGKRYGLNYKQLKYLFIDELPLVKNCDLVRKLAEERINKIFIVKYSSGQRRPVAAKEIRKFLADLRSQLSSSEIKGQVACRGRKKVYRGRVKVLASAKEADKVKSGDFLVTTMTTPDYVQAMKKAVGFITDEGGVTCHAAIIAREMNKPCLIGTKNATKLLRDGDLVEVDANKGIVKIVK